MSEVEDRTAKVEEIEMSLLLDGLYRYYGFDFRDYAPASLRRRVWNMVTTEKLSTISSLQDKLLHDSACMERFVLSISVNVTAMFRDPDFYLVFRQKFVPMLRTYPSIRIWHAGCATGEEVYSLAILLEEEGLYERCKIYATDINEAVLKQATTGIVSLDNMREYTSNYIRAGGTKSFSEYYSTNYDNAFLRPSLRRNITFAQHNLVTDAPFNEFHVIWCRNVIIYFNKNLQKRVHKLFQDSLITFGVLGLGSKETLPPDVLLHYEAIQKDVPLYRKIK